MPTYQFEAIDASTGKEIRDVVDAPTEAEAQATIRSQGYMITKIKVQKQAAAEGVLVRKSLAEVLRLGASKAETSRFSPGSFQF